MEKNLLYKRECKVNDKISIVIPTVGEIDDDMNNYYGLVSACTAMPIDMMVELDDMGIDFTEITPYELFITMFLVFLKGRDTHLLFGDLDLGNFSDEPGLDPNTGQMVLLDEKDDIVIDIGVYNKIADTLRYIHHMKKDKRKPVNKAAKDYLLERARIKRDRRRRNPDRYADEETQLEDLIVAMVNTSEFPYDYDGARNLSIYQFNESIRQVKKKFDYDHYMLGIFTGKIDPNDINPKDLNWLSR